MTMPKPKASDKFLFSKHAFSNNCRDSSKRPLETLYEIA